MATAALERSEIIIFFGGSLAIAAVALAAGHFIGYDAGQQAERKGTFGLKIPDVCGAEGSIRLPELQNNTDITVVMYDRHFKLGPNGLSGEFGVGPDGEIFFPVNADGEEGPNPYNDEVRFSLEEGEIKYRVKCEKQPTPTPTPTPKEPATPTPLSSQHDRLTAYHRGFNGTKPAGRGGTIFRRRG